MLVSNAYVSLYMLTFYFSLSISQYYDYYYDYGYNSTRHVGRMRIMGGKPAIRHQFPFLTSICKKDVRSKKRQSIIPKCTHRCAASLISDQWLLTAAHCFTQDIRLRNLMVVAGTLIPFETQSEQQFRGVQRYVIHPQYTSRRHLISNDIALVQVIRPFDHTQAVTNISVPYRTPRLAMATSPGWGIASNSRTFQIMGLQYLTVSIISNTECNRLLKSKGIIIKESHICTLPSVYENFCDSDAGSPLIQDNQIFGIISFSPQPCSATLKDDTLPNIYTNVYFFRKFINRFVK